MLLWIFRLADEIGTISREIENSKTMTIEADRLG